METNLGALFPPLGKNPQRAKTAHTTSSLPIAGNARVSTHPLLPPHHIKRRNQVNLRLHKQPHRRHHARHKTDSANAPCSMTDHIVGLYEAPELPEIEVLLRQGAASRATIVQMIAQGICRTSFNDVQRFPAIHPSIMSARKDRIVRYITFVSAPPFERRAPKDRPKSWDRRVFKPLGPEECFHCQLKTDHAVCERHKYLRVGGGFRHSYWYIKQTLDIIEEEHRKVAEEVRKRYEEEQLALKAKQGQTRRRIKMYVKGADGKIVSRYHFVTEEEYEEMKKDSKLAKKILGLADDEELDDWVSSKQKYVMDEKGELVKVPRQKHGDSAYEESLESGMGGRRHKGRRRYSDSDSYESGVGNSILEGDEAGRRRRRRHGRRRYSSVESVESYISEGGTRRERTVRRRRRRRSRDSSGSSYEDENGNRRRRHRRRRRSDSGTELDSNDSRSRGRRHRKGGRHRGRHRGDDSDGSYDSYDSRRGGRRRRGRRGSYSSGSDDSRSKRRGRRHRRRNSSSYSDDSEGGGKGRRRKGGRHHRSRHRRGHSSGSSDYSDSEDSRGRRRRHRRHRRDGSGGSTDGSYSVSGEDGERRHHRRGRRHRRRYSDDGDSGSADGHHKGRRHRRRYSDESESGSEGGGHRRRRRHRRRHSGDSDWSKSDDYDSEDDTKGGRRRRRRRRRSGSYSDSYSYSDGDGGSAGHGKHGRRRRRHRRGHSSDDYSDDASYDTDDDRRGGRKGGKKHRGGKHKRRGRRHSRHGSGSEGTFFDSDSDLDSYARQQHRRRTRGEPRDRARGGRRHRKRRDSRRSVSSVDSASSRRRSDRYNRTFRSQFIGKTGRSGSYSDGSSYDSYSSSVSLSDSSVVSDASTPSSVNSSDISDIDSNLDEEERIRIKAEKKAKKMLEKRAAKQQLKEETRKEAREAKRDQIRQEKKDRKREERGRRRKEKRRRHRTPTSRDISVCSSVSTVNSSDISDVDSALVGEERRLAIEAKKAKKKEQKKEKKQKEKVKRVQKQHREKRKEKERQRIKREIEREMDRMSTPSDVSSVHSSDLSSASDEEGLTAEEKAARKEERKKKKKAEKMQEKRLMKAVNKVMAKRMKKGRGNSGSSDDSYARGKQDFYNLTSQVVKSMVKYSKGSKRGLADEEGMEWLEDWKNQKTKDGKKKKGKKGKDQEDGEFIELTAPDGRKIRVPKTSLFDVWKMKKKIRLKKDGTVARDSDSDAESIEIDSDGNMVTQPKTVTFEDTAASSKWTGFAEPPLTPTQGGKIKFQGVRKVQHAFRKDKGVLTEHLKRVLGTASELSYPRPGDREEARRGYNQNSWESIDFLNHYRLVEGYKLDPLGRAFVVEDVDYDCTLTAEEMRSAIEGVPSLSGIKPKQLEYVLKVLDIDDHSDISFKMFAVISGICERMCNMDSFGRYILDKTNLLDIARKMALYKSIFYCNVNSERSVNHITSESLQIELIAGGLNKDQERYIMSKMNPNEYREISFFDYMAYIPLFLSMHENIIDNPLDRHEKYTTSIDYGEVQRDMNPMGLPLQREYLGVPKEIFPSGIPTRSVEDGTFKREFVEKGDLLENTVVGGKTGRLPSIGKKTSSPMSAKQGGRLKDPGLSMSLP